ncbi:MAG TPA: RNA polymerase sigma factor [Ignavibacteria bacterium]|nr:RNA polymerase sigma factor [Ignavibacteria bacterium]
MIKDESEVIKQLVLGDEKAFKSIFKLYRNMVYNTALGFLTNVNDAEDITQEVFIQVFRSIEQFKEESKLSTWIYRITITKCLDLIRKRKTKKRFAFIVDIFDKNEKEYFINYDHPGVETENRELSKTLFREIDKLPENQRIAFVLNKIEQLSYKEISEVMETSISAVESLIFRAKANLKMRLEKFYRS